MPLEILSGQHHRHRHLVNANDEREPCTSVGSDHTEITPIELTDGECAERTITLIQAFKESKAGFQIVFLITLLAMGEGSVIGVIPSVMTDRYAHLEYDLPENATCRSFETIDKPEACFAGSADAEQAMANRHLIANAFTFFTSSLIGSLSDEYGRKPLLIFGLLVSCISPLILVLLQLRSSMSPFYYYATGVVRINWYVVAMSSLADVLPPQWRAPSFGILSAGYSVGQALSPRFSLWFGYLAVSIWSLVTLVLGVVIVLICVPETLPEETRVRTRLQSKERQMAWWYRPLWELSILNRNSLFRMLSSLAFFSGMVSAADYTLLIYYLQERLSFNDEDIANLYMLMGVLGIFVQSFVLKAMLEKVGERSTITVSFAFGALHNLLYSVARDKTLVFVAMTVGTGVTMAFPTISALKANNVKDSEQGRIQGALYSVQAISSGFGPTMMRQIYGWSEDGTSILWGPGTMFLFAALFYGFAVYCASQLPEEADASHQSYEETNQSPADDVVDKGPTHDDDIGGVFL